MTGQVGWRVRHSDGVELDRLAASQHGVLSRAQALETLTAEQVRWRLTKGIWVVVHPGIYQTHAGPVDWLARASAVLLHLGVRAALSLGSAAYLLGIEDRQPPVITAVVPHNRQPVRVPGARVSRRRAAIVTTTRKRLSVTAAASTVLDLGDVAGVSRQDAISVAARAVQRGKASVDGLRAELAGRRTHRHRQALELALGVVALGAESGLEVDFHELVLARHGLPAMRMAVPEGSGPGSIRRDAVNEELGVVVELDGTIGHGAAERARDNRRDRLAARRGRVTLRAGWVDVELEPCELALDVHGTLASRGHRGAIVPCSPTCVARHAGRRAG